MIQYNKTRPSANWPPQCIPSQIPGWPLRLSNILRQEQQNCGTITKFLIVQNSGTVAKFLIAQLAWLSPAVPSHLISPPPFPILSLVAHVQPIRLSSLALLDCILKFYSYYLQTVNTIPKRTDSRYLFHHLTGEVEPHFPYQPLCCMSLPDTGH